MKFGVLQFFSWPDRRVPLETIYQRGIDRALVMDKTGYDCVWIAEHHFSGYSVCPSVHLMATHIAAKTKTLRIGTAVSLAAFHHPLRLAEEAALLDILSDGRLNWGAGRGFDRKEFEAFGVTREESYARFHEHVDIVIQSWRSERLTYKGRFHTFNDIEVLPKPAQKPHPPVWLATSSPEAIEMAAAKGHSIQMDPHASHLEIGRKRKFYQEQLEKNGHTIDGRDIPMARLLAVADTQAEAESIAMSGAQWMFASYLNPKIHNDLADLRSFEGRAEGDHTPTPERYLKDVIIHGTPEAVVEKLQQLQEEICLQYLLCAPLSHSSFTLFTEKVLPSFL